MRRLRGRLPSWRRGIWTSASGRPARDSSGNRHNGAIIGRVGLGIPGAAGTAYRFVPQSAVVVRDAPDLHPGRARVTISYWVKLITRPPPYVSDYDIFVKGDAYSRGGQMKLEVQRNGQASCMFRGALGEKQLQAGPNLINGRWHKVTCQRVGDRIIATSVAEATRLRRRLGRSRTRNRSGSGPIEAAATGTRVRWTRSATGSDRRELSAPPPRRGPRAKPMDRSQSNARSPAMSGMGNARYARTSPRLRPTRRAKLERAAMKFRRQPRALQVAVLRARWKTA